MGAVPNQRGLSSVLLKVYTSLWGRRIGNTDIDKSTYIYIYIHMYEYVYIHVYYTVYVWPLNGPMRLSCGVIFGRPNACWQPSGSVLKLRGPALDGKNPASTHVYPSTIDPRALVHKVMQDFHIINRNINPTWWGFYFADSHKKDPRTVTTAT